jgi:hypothetical protein
MCCLFLAVGLLGPRLGFLGVWLFSSPNRVTLAYQGGWLLPLLGVLFLPWTALFYVLSYAPVVGVSAIGWLFVGLGFVADMATYSSRSAQKRYYATNASA